MYILTKIVYTQDAEFVFLSLSLSLSLKKKKKKKVKKKFCISFARNFENGIFMEQLSRESAGFFFFMRSFC